MKGKLSGVIHYAVMQVHSWDYWQFPQKNQRRWAFSNVQMLSDATTWQFDVHSKNEMVGENVFLKHIIGWVRHLVNQN